MAAARVLRGASLAYTWQALLSRPNRSAQQDRHALLKILSEVEEAINAQDIEGILAQMSPDCTVTWWNAEISRGHAEIRAYYRKMVKDEGRYISKARRDPAHPRRR